MLGHLLPITLPWSSAQPSAPRLGPRPPPASQRWGTGPVVQPPGRAVGQDGLRWGHTSGDRPRLCHRQQEHRASQAWHDPSTGQAAGAGFGENSWEMSSAEPVPRLTPTCRDLPVHGPSHIQTMSVWGIVTPRNHLTPQVPFPITGHPRDQESPELHLSLGQTFHQPADFKTCSSGNCCEHLRSHVAKPAPW